jgi:DNA-directed RNA polymerase specialized sigma24 family protein
LLSMHQGSENKEIQFPSTHWSKIREVVEGTADGQRLAALGDLLTRYHSPLIGYSMRKFAVTEDQARDLLQSFIVESVVKRELIGRARPMKGYQFRSYLLCAWHNHILEDHRKQQCQKRRPPGGITSLSTIPEFQEAWAAEPSHDLFDVAWARDVLAKAVERARIQCEASGNPALWGIFESRVQRPLCEGAAPIPYHELVVLFKLDSPIQARNLLVTGKRIFMRCLRGIVAEYAESQSAIDTELRELHIILERAS